MWIYKSSKTCFLKEEEEEAIHLKLKATTKIFKIVDTKKEKRKKENLWLLRRFMDIKANAKHLFWTFKDAEPSMKKNLPLFPVTTKTLVLTSHKIYPDKNLTKLYKEYCIASWMAIRN